MILNDASIDRPGRFSILRVAVAVLCFTTCALLIWLTVRSYRSLDIAFGPLTATQTLSFESIRGNVNVRVLASARAVRWGIESYGRQTRRFGINMVHGYLFSVPHWLLAFVAATLGALPLTTHCRFGRLLTIAVFTTVGVLCGLISVLRR